MNDSQNGYRTAVVTGASAGIGAAFAEALAATGSDLVVVARDTQRLEALAARLGRDHGTSVRVVTADLTTATDLARVEEMLRDDATVDLLVNNAGFGTVGDFATLDVEAEEREIRLNVVALVRLTRAVLPGLLARRRGGVINVSSMAGFLPAPFNATYGATKAYVNSFTEAVAEEIRDSGVRVQALCPGFTRTEFQERAGIDTSSIPALAWMEAADVVTASLQALRAGPVVVVPGLANRATTALAGLLPRRLVARALGASAKRLLPT